MPFISAARRSDTESWIARERVTRFQTDPACKLFHISLKAGGSGLNLTAADYVYLLDPWWNPAVEAQAIDRTHRPGQTRPVLAYRLIAENTSRTRSSSSRPGSGSSPTGSSPTAAAVSPSCRSPTSSCCSRSARVDQAAVTRLRHL